MRRYCVSMDGAKGEQYTLRSPARLALSVSRSDDAAAAGDVSRAQKVTDDEGVDEEVGISNISICC
jgi:hypothetical protein